MIEAVAGLVAAIAQLFLEIVVYLLTLILSSAYVSTRTKGVSRIASVTATLFGLYLLTAILRGFVPALASPNISIYFSSILIVVIFILFLVALSIPFAISAIHQGGDSDVKDVQQSSVVADESELKVPWLFTYLLSIALVFGGLVFWSTTYKVPTMEERFCKNLAVHVNPNTAENASRGLAILEGVLDRELDTKIPCINADETE